MPGPPVVFFLPVRYWAVNWRYSYSDSLTKDQGSVRVSIVRARSRDTWSRRAAHSLPDSQDMTSA